MNKSGTSETFALNLSWEDAQAEDDARLEAISAASRDAGSVTASSSDDRPQLDEDGAIID